MKIKFDNYLKFNNEIMAVANFLDPRYKMLPNGWYHKKTHGMYFQAIDDIIEDSMKF